MRRKKLISADMERLFEGHAARAAESDRATKGA